MKDEIGICEVDWEYSMPWWAVPLFKLGLIKRKIPGQINPSQIAMWEQVI